MKKVKAVILLSLVASGLTLIQPVSASEQKSLVIIDSYFGSEVIKGNVSCITVHNLSCLYTDPIKPNSAQGSATNHGSVMIEVAKKQNPNIKIIALSTADSKNFVDGGLFIDALKWVDNNSNKVAAVSFSGFFNSSGKICTIASKNTAKHGGAVKSNEMLRNLVLTLKSKNIPVFAATGNKKGNKIDYPACINEVVSVTTGDRDNAGEVVSEWAMDQNTDYVAASDSVIPLPLSIFGSVPRVTSVATVAVATKWVTDGILTDRVVKILQ